MTSGQIYNLVSLVAAISAVFAVWAAVYAMRRGLTYAALNATAVVLVFVALGRVWHTAREFMGLATWSELVEYLLYIVGNLYFALATYRSMRARGPEAIAKPQS